MDHKIQAKTPTPVYNISYRSQGPVKIEAWKSYRITTINKIIRIVRALSLVNSCVKMRVCKHGCDITQILIGYVLSDAHFDWLVVNECVSRKSMSIKK